MLYSIGFLVAWLVVLMWVAELVRNTGRYTLADVLATRMRQRPVRAAAGISSVVVTLLYLIAQMVGAGSLVALLLGSTGAAAKTWTIVAVGALMIIYVTVGGMRATTWIQIVKALMLMAGAVLLTVLVLVHFHGDLAELMHAAARGSGAGDKYLEPGLKYGAQHHQPARLRQPGPGPGARHRRPAAHPARASTPCPPRGPPGARPSGRSAWSAPST